VKEYIYSVVVKVKTDRSQNFSPSANIMSSMGFCCVLCVCVHTSKQKRRLIDRSTRYHGCVPVNRTVWIGPSWPTRRDTGTLGSEGGAFLSKAFIACIPSDSLVMPHTIHHGRARTSYAMLLHWRYCSFVKRSKSETVASK
jgi:hypothetical protein